MTRFPDETIQIKHPLSLTTWVDPVAMPERNGDMTQLKNYIPERGSIITRRGIESLVHTPQGTTPTPAYSPTADATCIIWTRFETTATLYDDEIQGASFWNATAGNTYSAAASRKEGVGSFYSDYYTLPGAGLNQNVFKEHTALETINFPGYVTGKHSYIMSIWWRPTYFPDGTSATSFQIQRHDPSQPGGFEIQPVDAVPGTWKLQYSVCNSAGANRIISSGITLTQGTWYHIGVWSSETVGNTGLVVYDSYTSAEETSVASPAIVHAGTYTAGLSVNGWDFKMTTTNRSGRGHMDDLIVCVGDLADQDAFLAKIRNMRASTRATYAGNDFSSDTDAVALYTMDGTYNDSLNSYHMSALGNPTYTYECAEGIRSVLFSATATADHLRITDANLDADFPGNAGFSGSFSICFWVRVLTTGVRQALISKYNAAGGYRSYALLLESNNQIRYILGHGATFSEVYSGVALSANQWYHIAVTYTTSTKAMTMRVHNDDGTIHSNVTATATLEFTGTAANFEVARYNQSGNFLDGYVDEVVVFKKALTNDEIDKVYAGTFGG